MLMSKSRLEKFLYALYSLDSSDLPTPMSRIEELYNCWVTGADVPTFEPLSRVEKYLMAILGVYDIDSLPNPLSRVEMLLYKLATGDDNLDDIKSFLSEHEELLAEIIRNGGVGGDIGYVLYTLSTEHNMLYNTAEKPVKSAILKGQTLVNITKPIEFDATITTTGLQHLESYYGIYNITPTTDKQYLVCCYIHENTIGTFSLNKTGYYDDITLTSKSDITQTSGVVKYIANCNGDEKTLFTIGAEANAVAGRLHITCMVLEYQEGMENWDIPYFEGMQSVKMPVLTITGKNLFDVKDKLISGEYIYNSPYIYVPLDKGVINTVNTTTISIVGTSDKPLYCLVTVKPYYSSTYEPIALDAYGELKRSNSITPQSSIHGEAVEQQYYLSFYLNNEDETNIKNYLLSSDINIQLEKGVVATTYEPYKSNILTVNEDIELRGIGDVKDELNLLTGELTERIGEIVFNGGEEWTMATTKVNTQVFSLNKTGNTLNNIKNNSLLICDKLKVASGIDEEIITFSNTIYMGLSKSKASSVDMLRTYLTQNPITVYYQLKTESIKTVDISTVDQDRNKTKLGTFNDITHVTLSSEGLIPEAELEVATKNEEVINAMSLEMDDICATQTTLEETTNIQSENVDATMIATTEIYEQIL